VLMFLLGILTGVVGISALWILYITYFNSEADSLGARVREWFRSLRHRQQ